jgi:hypothetical protein
MPWQSNGWARSCPSRDTGGDARFNQDKLSALVAAVKTALADSEYHDGLTTCCNQSALRQFY